MKKITLLFIGFILAFFSIIKVSANDNFQTVLDTIKSGSTVYIRSGVFTTNVSYKISNKKNITIVFNKGCEIYCTAKNDNVFEINSCNNIHIYNGKFKHQVFEDDICLGVVFMIGNSNNIYLSNCDINGSGSRGIRTNLVENLVVENCNIHGNSTAAYLFYNDCKNFKLYQNILSNNGASGDVKFDFKKADYEADRIADSEIEERQFTSNEQLIFDSIQIKHNGVFQKMENNIVLVEYDYKFDPEYVEIKNGLYYYTRSWEDPDLMGCKSQTLLSVKDNTVRIYSFGFCDATGGSWSYGFGRIKGKTLSAIFYSAHIEDITAEPMGVDTTECKILLSSDLKRIQITSYNYDKTETISLESIHSLNYRFTGGVKNFRESPSVNARVLSKIDVTKTEIKLLEIGKSEMISKTYDCWYKVKINGVEGWLFGGLNLD